MKIQDILEDIQLAEADAPLSKSTVPPANADKLQAMIQTGEDAAADVLKSPWYKNWMRYAGNTAKFIGTVAERAVWPLLAAAEAIKAYHKIKQIDPKDPDRLDLIKAIVGGQVAEFGLTLVSAELGALVGGAAGTALFGIGAAPGALVGALAAGIGSQYVFPDANALSLWIVENLMDDETPQAAAPQKPATAQPAVQEQGMIHEGGISREDLSDAITQRMMRSGMATKLLKVYGLDAVIDAISQVTAMHQGMDEIGSSDLSIMIKQVTDNLAMGHGQTGYKRDHDDMVEGWKSDLHELTMDEDVLLPKGHKAKNNDRDDRPGIDDFIIMELGDGRAIQARISEVRGNSMVLDLDDTAHTWLDESPRHDDLMIKGERISKVADAWNRMVRKLPADTPTGWAAVFASEESRTGHAARGMARKWAKVWRAQHEDLGDSLTLHDALTWVDEVNDILDARPMNESDSSQSHGRRLRNWLDPKDPAMLAVWMAARAGSKGKSIKGFAQQTARSAGHPEDTYWDKIKRIVSESKHGRRALMRLYDIEPVTAVDDDFVIASDVHEYDDNRKLTWNLYKKVVPTQDKMEPAYYHVAHLDLSPYGDFTKDQLMAAARDAMKNADVMVDEDDVHQDIKPLASIEDILQQVFDSDADVTLQDKPHGYTAYVLINRPLDGNEELATEQALFRAGYDVDRVECKDNGVGGIKTNIYLKSKPESDVSEARPDVLGMAESAGDHQSVEKRYYIVRKGKPPAATPGIQGFHSVSAAEDKLNSMSDPDGYNIVAIDSPKKDVRTEGYAPVPHDARAKMTDIINDVLGTNIKPRLLKPASKNNYLTWTVHIPGVQEVDDMAETDIGQELVRAGFDPELVYAKHNQEYNEAVVVIRLNEPYEMPDPEYTIEAKYQGREVQLGKPIRTNTGEGGKFKVYVRDPKTGNIKMVRFGDTTGLTIKRDDPKRRKNFRARHHCDNPGPRTKARFWSCKMWTKKPVSKILKGK